MSKQMALRKKMKGKLKKLVAKKREREMKLKAYVLFQNIIKVGLMHAATQDIPPLVSVRMRNLSDIILQHLADLRGVKVPERQNPGEFPLKISKILSLYQRQTFIGSNFWIFVFNALISMR